jgi:hypothetical protein
MTERQKVKKFIEEASKANLLVKLGPNNEDVHYVERLEQAENGKLVIHAWNRGSSPQISLCLLDIDAPIWIRRNL